ncbi:hypothetical protein F5Y03DRAFT_174371 [Xylaria venustula]|nr:hypothetical protein F5Y03DRAFT_174371 [Xylaria venustula]
MQFEPSPKNTPNRRRPPASRGRNAGQKVYASENDVPSYKPNKIGSPSTPQKPVSSRSAAPQTQSTNPKQRNKGNKSRNAKTGVTSPDRRLDGESPSLQFGEAPPTIFAGSTFHASPAPSALPLPSFLGLPNADSPVARGKVNESTQDSTPPQTDSDEGSPVDELVPRNVESPLDIFFRADRAEKARVRRASSANTDATSSTPFSPLRDSSRKECNTFPKTIAHHSRRLAASNERDYSPGVSSELGGSSRLSVGPAFSTPYSERIRAARSSPNSGQPTPSMNRNSDPTSSEALKRYLFTGQLGRPEPQDPSLGSNPSQIAQPAGQKQHRSVANRPVGGFQASQRSFSPIPNLPRGGLASRAPRPEPASSVHFHPESSPRSDHIIALEGNLRRVLKLDALG